MASHDISIDDKIVSDLLEQIPLNYNQKSSYWKEVTDKIKISNDIFEWSNRL